MADHLSSTERSALMSKVRRRDTTPEMAVRRIAHRLGYRFRLSRKDLPGRPDLVFPRYKAVVFVHGCFWHKHSACRRGSLPKTSTAYWREKLDRNTARDARVIGELERLGWKVAIIWECEARHAATVIARLQETLNEPTEAPS